MSGELKKSIKVLQEATQSELEGTQHEFGAAVSALQDDLNAGAVAAHIEVQDLDVKMGENLEANKTQVETELSQLLEKMQSMRVEILGDAKNDGTHKSPQSVELPLQCSVNHSELSFGR